MSVTLKEEIKRNKMQKIKDSSIWNFQKKIDFKNSQSCYFSVKGSDESVFFFSIHSRGGAPVQYFKLLLVMQSIRIPGNRVLMSTRFSSFFHKFFLIFSQRASGMLLFEKSLNMEKWRKNFFQFAFNSSITSHHGASENPNFGYPTPSL